MVIIVLAGAVLLVGGSFRRYSFDVATGTPLVKTHYVKWVPWWSDFKGSDESKTLKGDYQISYEETNLFGLHSSESGSQFSISSTTYGGTLSTQSGPTSRPATAD